MTRKNRNSIIIGLIIGILLLAAWLYYTPLAEIKSQIAKVNYNWVVIASIAYLSAYFLRSLRWRLLIPAPANPNIFKTWLYAMAGNLLNYLIPIRAGDFTRAWFIKKDYHLPYLKALPSVFVDKVFDTIAILFIIIVLPFIAVELSSPMLILLCLLTLIFIVAFAILLVSVWKKDLVVKIIAAIFSWLPKKAKARINPAIEMFISELNLFEHHPFKLILAFFLTAGGVLLDGLYFYLLFRAFGILYPFALVLFGYTLINLSYAIPQPPAQLGSNEWMMIIIFSMGFGLTKTTASAIMAFGHILTAGLMSLWGIIALAVLGPELFSKVIKGDKIDD
ncbi:MAG TPA: lysylphosphatidylglycerol synthase transmembrane domain-containing protein [Candidatus Cloacimonas sp.]|jgi:uncharacterized protein (TIRG00374 family)|nr:lysylphosphatidylglycerol synthase transmembrane domain-containing protein [Candidatus Cloacimonas sp.]HPS60351.1 lysylphosphatidylglycerol synthase transmembrane domain-containing protein [Candidatus Cloacimonas sp.]